MVACTDPNEAVSVWQESNARTGRVPAGRLGADIQLDVQQQVRELYEQCLGVGVHFDGPDEEILLDGLQDSRIFSSGHKSQTRPFSRTLNAS